MSTDRELLELAAKAAGYKKYYAHCLGRDSFVTYDEEYYSEVKERRVVGEKTLDWNPLADDGDALRLAVRCAQLFGFHRFLRAWLIAMATENGNPADPLAATRRAIVRAAAEIGRSRK